MSEDRNNNPFAMTVPAASGGALAQSSMSAAVAEIQAKLVIARTNPRDQVAVMDSILNACTRPTLAESAVYQYARGGTEISGPSIRLAEAIAQSWGNLEWGFRELSRGVDAGVTYSDIEAFAWDLERNTRRAVSFRVRHWRDTKKGGYPLSDERDIYEITANQAQRRVRACILAVVPGDVPEAAVNQCEITLKSKVEITPEMLAALVEKFAGFGVTKEQIEKRIQRRLDTIVPAQVLSLRKIYNSLRDGMSSSAEWFEVEPETVPTGPAAQASGGEGSRSASLKDRARAAAANKKEDPGADKFAGLRKELDSLRTMEGFSAWMGSHSKEDKAILMPDIEATQARIKGSGASASSAASGSPHAHNTAAPSMTYAEVADHLHKAGDVDTLDAYGPEIELVVDLVQRKELSDLYRKKRAELTGDVPQ